MEIRFDDGEQFRQLAARFRAAGKDGAAVRKALTASIQAEFKPVVVDIQRAVRAMKVRSLGNGGGGARARARFDAAKELRRQAKAAALGKQVRARRTRMPSGLRERVARSVKSKVSYTGRSVGAKIYVDPSNLPASQRKLPRHMNDTRGWRHPVFGHRDRWVKQVGEPYFDRPISRYRERVRRNVAAAVNKVMETLK